MALQPYVPPSAQFERIFSRLHHEHRYPFIPCCWSSWISCGAFLMRYPSNPSDPNPLCCWNFPKALLPCAGEHILFITSILFSLGRPVPPMPSCSMPAYASSHGQQS
eukprot:6214098-Pleurochrysis_carterae.AAC.1